MKISIVLILYAVIVLIKLSDAHGRYAVVGETFLSDAFRTGPSHAERIDTFEIYKLVRRKMLDTSPTIIIRGGLSQLYKERGFGSSQSNTIEIPYEKRTINDFSTRDSRLGFIRKVYSIFSAQMLATIGITGFIIASSSFRDLIMRNYESFFVTSLIVSIGSILALVYSPNLRHSFPQNFLILAIYTLFQALTVGVFSSMFSPRLVCLGSMHTLTAFAMVTLYSFQPNPRYDLTPFGYCLLTSFSSLVIGGILSQMFQFPILDNLISAGMAVLAATYLAYDTQMIVGGKHRKHQYSPREYILAALNLYQDAINLFIRIMIILGKNEKRRNE